MNKLQIEPSWQAALKDHLFLLDPPMEFIEKEKESNVSICPPEHLIFNAFWKTPYDKVKVVIVGQDPYHGIGQAEGLCFSVPKDVLPPPSLKNIFKEISADLGLSIPSHGSLTSWAEQGVLLLNATLTVREGEALSHHGIGWEDFTDAVIAKLCERKDPIIFVLWGKSAQKKGDHIRQMSAHHHVLTAAHPSPFSARRGFFGCRHFSSVNTLLTQLGKEIVDWTLSTVK